MRLLITLLLQNPQLVKFVPDVSSLKALKEPGFELLTDIVSICQQNTGISMGGLLEHYRAHPQYNILETLASWEHLVLPENIETTFIDTLDFLYAKLVECRKEELIAKDRTVGLTDDEKKSTFF